jgi:hypothetical protein
MEATLALTERQRDMILSQLDKKMDRIIRLLDPPQEEPRQRTVKKDPNKLYGGGVS